MSRRHRRGTLLVVLLAVAGGCVNRPGFLQPAPEREWPETIARAHAAVEGGQFASADSLLAEFAARFPESGEANETVFWRAVYRLDPANPDASPSRAVSELTTYMARPGRHTHLAEARALRRAATLADSLSSHTGRRAAAPADAAAATDKDAEIARLREELKRATEELERIKRRLSTPTP
jgi:hypothetical protein